MGDIKWVWIYFGGRIGNGFWTSISHEFDPCKTDCCAITETPKLTDVWDSPWTFARDYSADPEKWEIWMPVPGDIANRKQVARLVADWLVGIDETEAITVRRVR